MSTDWLVSLFTDFNWLFVVLCVVLVVAAFALAFVEPSRLSGAGPRSHRNGKA